MFSPVIFVVLLVGLFTISVKATQAKPLCYSGSTLYQKIVQDCSTKDPSYTGEWYCATMTICESFINKGRECVETRGCATQEECTSSTSSTFYDGNTVQVTSGINPAGMTITASCCKAHDFPDDDAIAIDYSDVCNSAPAGRTAAMGLTGLVALLSVTAYLMSA